MPLITDGIEGWKTNLISYPPYRVELMGPYKYPQVVGANGTVGLSGPGGAICQASIEQAEQLCELANAGLLPKVK